MEDNITQVKRGPGIHGPLCPHKNQSELVRGFRLVRLVLFGPKTDRFLSGSLLLSK